MALFFALAFLSPPSRQVIRVDPTVVIRHFDPRTAFGAGIDGHETGDIRRMLSRRNVREMKSLGLQSLTYRLRTELGCEVWHWNLEGTWSDEANKQGYWTSAATSTKPINLSYGFRLPRRGDSIDQANRDDYSRLDDGDPNTFWKSNPYLDPVYTGVPYSKSPQWIVMDFGKAKEFDEIRIDWADPYATRFKVSYMENQDEEGPWHIPANSQTSAANTRESIIRTSRFKARYIKIELLASSETGPAGTSDKRDKLGFAIREISAGIETKGAFRDEVVHAKTNQKQTLMYVSSTDPWHRESDKDPRVEQPGFDLLLRLGLDQGQSILLPTGCLYDTPENVGNEAAWLKAKGINIRGIELGEEADGNWADGDQYAFLYMQMATAIRKELPNVPLGGPSYQTIQEDFVDWPHTGKPWLTQFKDALQARGKLGEFNFCSFEWYPFDDTKGDPAQKLVKTERLFKHGLGHLKQTGMGTMPWYVTEYGYSSFGAPAEVTSPGAVFNFDSALLALSLGGITSYLYGYEPNELIEEVKGEWGNNMVLMQRDDDLIKMPAYWGTWLLTHRLCMPEGDHELIKTSGDDENVGTYAVRRPDGSTGLVLLNRTPLERATSVDSSSGKLTGWTYGDPQFAWSHVSATTLPSRNLPPTSVEFSPSDVKLPPYSITILELSKG